MSCLREFSSELKISFGLEIMHTFCMVREGKKDSSEFCISISGWGSNADFKCVWICLWGWVDHSPPIRDNICRTSFFYVNFSSLQIISQFWGHTKHTVWMHYLIMCICEIPVLSVRFLLSCYFYFPMPKQAKKISPICLQDYAQTTSPDLIVFNKELKAKIKVINFVCGSGSLSFILRIVTFWFACVFTFMM